MSLHCGKPLFQVTASLPFLESRCRVTVGNWATSLTLLRRAGLLMVAETISLGILALPHALSILGLVPGVFFLVVFGALATYTGFVIGQLRLRHEHIHSTADAGEMLLGRLGKEVVMAGQILFVVFIMGAHLTSFSLAVTVLMGDSQVCSVLLLFAGFILSFLLTIPRTLRHMSYYCIASFLSILAAVVTTMVAVGIERPTAHNDHLDIRLWPQPGLDFFSAFNAVSAIIFAYAAHVAFFTFISELKDPRDFPKALTLLQITDVSMYIVTAVVIYVFSGNDVAALALDSARKDWRKVAFGVALPTIVIAGVINGHIAVKWIYVRLLRDSKEDLIHKKTLKARGIWIVVAFVTWLTAWLISEIIPLFGDLVGLTGALFGSWFTYGLQGFFWFMMMYKREGWRLRKRGDWQMGWRKRFLTALNLLNILIGFVVFIAGTLSASKVINDHTSTAGKPFSCTIRA